MNWCKAVVVLIDLLMKRMDGSGCLDVWNVIAVSRKCRGGYAGYL